MPFFTVKAFIHRHTSVYIRVIQVVMDKPCTSRSRKRVHEDSSTTELESSIGKNIFIVVNTVFRI